MPEVNAVRKRTGDKSPGMQRMWLEWGQGDSRQALLAQSRETDFGLLTPKTVNLWKPQEFTYFVCLGGYSSQRKLEQCFYNMDKMRIAPEITGDGAQ